jgi:ribosomal protein S1
MSHRPIGSPAEMVNVGDELTLLVIRVDPHERRIGLSLKELAHAIAPPPEVEDPRGGGRKGKRGKSRDYDYDDEE